MANRFPLIFNSGAGQIQELAVSDNLDLTSSNLVNAGILFTSSGSATAPSLQIGSGTTYNPGLYSPGTDQLAISTSGVGRLFVDSAGKIGIGAASVVGLLQIKYATDVHTSFRNATAGGLSAGTLIESVNDAFNSYNPIYLKGSQFTFGTDSAGSFVERLRLTSTGALNFVGAGAAGSTQAVSFNGSAPVNSLVIDSSGRLGIGNSSPSAKLDVEALNFAGGPAIGVRYNTSNVRLGFNVANSNGFTYIGSNTNNKLSSDSATYDLTGQAASQLRLDNGQLIFNNAPSGTAGNDITFTNRLTITSAGLVGIGSTAPDVNLVVSNGGTSSSASGGTLARVVGSGVSRLDIVGGNSNYSILEFSRANLTAAGQIAYEHSTNSLYFSVNGAQEAVRIDSSKRLLVGTNTTTSAGLVVIQGNSSSSTGGALVSIQRGATSPTSGSLIGELRFADSSSNNGAFITAEADSNWTSGTFHPTRLSFYTAPSSGSASPTERMRISQNGNILMTSSQLTVSSAAGSNTFDVQAQNAVGANVYIYLTCPGSNQGAVWYERATSRLYVYSQSGGVYLGSTATSWTANSDERLKDIIEPIENATEKVSSLRAVIGKYKSDEEGTRRSFLIAQDVQAVLPEAVSTDNPDQLGVAYTDVIPLLVAAIKEQQSMISALQTKVAALEAQ